MAFPANVKMLIQLSCTQKVRRVQIWAGAIFLLFSNFGQIFTAQILKKKSKTSICNLIKGQKAKIILEMKKSDNFNYITDLKQQF